MKKIGFVDYMIDEWHANNYPAWIDKVCRENGYDCRVAYAWAMKNGEGLRSTQEWCADFGVIPCETLEELCDKSDYIVILAPSNPEVHWELASKVLPYGKPTYIDKTFAPDYDTAKQFVEIAKRHNTPFFSTSALRYAAELYGVQADEIAVTGGGGSFDEYAVHQIEMVVKTLNIGAKSVKVEQNGSFLTGFIRYNDGRFATVTYAQNLPFTAYTVSHGEGGNYRMIQSDFFTSLIGDMLRFFETKVPSFAIEQTLEVMKIRSALLDACREQGVWLPLIQD